MATKATNHASCSPTEELCRDYSSDAETDMHYKTVANDNQQSHGSPENGVALTSKGKPIQSPSQQQLHYLSRANSVAPTSTGLVHF